MSVVAKIALVLAGAMDGSPGSFMLSGLFILNLMMAGCACDVDGICSNG
jgi:hypothetical protein